MVGGSWSQRPSCRKPDAAAAFCELQLAAQMVSHFIADHHRELEAGRRTVVCAGGRRRRENCAFRKGTREHLRTSLRKCGIPERDEQVVGKISDAVSIPKEV